ncbi:MAG TPA: penicillin-binding protein 1C [Nannocystis sp.]
MSTRQSRLRRWTLRLSLGTVAACAVTCGTWSLVRARVGDPAAQLDDRWHAGHRVLDRRGQLLRELPSDTGVRGQPLELEAMGPRLIQATLTSEDADFYEPGGVDGRAIARATAQNLRHGRMVSGASTITQQLVKLLDNRGSPRIRGITDKLGEAARAQNLEAVLGKPEILREYLNRLPYGHGMVGPEAAARAYFGVASKDLSWAQAAFLAVLPRAPSYLDPYAHPERVLLRQRALLNELHADGHLNAREHERALAEPIDLRPLERPFLAPHLINTLIAEGDLSSGTATVTTLDTALQQSVEGLTRTHLASIAERGATDAAVIVVDNASGEVLAYVGSADFHDVGIAGQVDMARALRQPGSTLKPFVYALAFADGHSAAEMTADVETTFAEPGGNYRPENFDHGHEGPLPLREALAGSLNIPAVRLAFEQGPRKLLELLHTIGFASLDRPADYYGLALALGSGEVELRELAAAYATLARGGRYAPLRVTVDDPQTLGAPAETVPAIDPAVAALVTESLADPLARVRGLHGRGPFSMPYPAAIKTGTSSGYRDTWTVGYTRERTVAVWLGNADGAPTAKLTGASGAGPLFADVMARAMRDVPQRAPLWDAELLARVEVCPLSGLPAGPACDERATRNFLADHLPEGTCDLHVHVRRDASAPAGWRCDADGRETAVVFPPVFDAWLAERAAVGATPDPFGRPWLPRARVPGCAGPAAPVPSVRLSAPAPGSVFSMGLRHDHQTIELRAELAEGGEAAARALGELEFVVDGVVAARSAWPYQARIPATPGDHEILARPADPRLAARLEPVQFSVR